MYTSYSNALLTHEYWCQTLAVRADSVSISVSVSVRAVM
jgi:hypothetical protein